MSVGYTFKMLNTKLFKIQHLDYFLLLCVVVVVGLRESLKERWQAFLHISVAYDSYSMYIILWSQ